MNVGFARVDISPMIGSYITGYYEPRYVEGVLDPLLATAVVFEDGVCRAALLSLDLLGIKQDFMGSLRSAIAEAIDAPAEAVLISCTHTHLGPPVATGLRIARDSADPVYNTFLTNRLRDAAHLALLDAAPSRFFAVNGKCDDVTFVRSFRMKDGSVSTNPGWQHPDIVEALRKPDETSRLLIIRREGKPEIGIVNFQVHPDTIHGCKTSADYPKFVRDTYEHNVPNSLCMYLNGCAGDLNHIDVRQNPETECADGYLRTKYMGKKIAMSVLANYELAKEIPCDGIRYAEKRISVRYYKGTPEQLPEALALAKLYYEKGSEGALPHISGMARTVILAEACRIERMEHMPDKKELCVSAISVGGAAFAGFPGEPFCDVGVSVRNASPFPFTLTVECANGFEGYYPVRSAYDQGGYEAAAAQYVPGTAEKLVETSLELLDKMGFAKGE